MTAWNPHSPDTLGLETLFTEQGDQLLPAAATFTSTAAETVDSLSPFLIAASEESATCLLEVFEAGDEVPTAQATTTIFRPTDDLQIGGADSEDSSWATSSLGTTNLYQRIDEASLSVADWITYFDGMAAAKKYRFCVDTGGSDWPANQRVVGGRVKLVANREEINGTLRAYYFDGTTAHYLGSVVATQKRKTLSIPWPEFNPATNLPWTRAEIQALDVGGGSAIQLRPRNVNKQKQLFIYQAWLELDWVPEERVAVGVREISLADTGDDGAAIPFTLQVPNSGVDNWSKADSTAYTWVLRRIDGFGRVSARFLAETATVAEAVGRDVAGEALPLSSYIPVLDTRGFVSTLGDVVAGRALSFVQTRTDTAVSVDGQPYFRPVRAPFFDGSGAGQEFTPAASTLTRLRVLFDAVAYDDALQDIPATPGQIAEMADIEVKVKVRSTDVQVGSTTTVTAADVLAGIALSSYFGAGTAFLVDIDLTGVTATAVEHYVEFTTDEPDRASPGDLSWAVVGVGGSSSATEPPTFGGSALALILQTNETTPTSLGAGADALLTLSTQPDAPTGFSAAIVAESVNTNLGCTIPTTETVALAWVATSLFDDFDRYEIQRRTGDGDWVLILTGDDEAVEAAVDRDPTLGVTESYRMRVVRAGDHVGSPWTATVTATAEAVGAEVVFSSNWSRSALAYNRGPSYDWDFPNNDEVLELAGRDFATVFQEAEDRGDRFSIPVLFLVADPGLRPDEDGRAVAEPLRAWLRSGVPHVTVRDPYGGRWFGHATLTDASQAEDQATGVFTGTVVFVQTQADPTAAPI